jgi:hypothetical protein
VKINLMNQQIKTSLCTWLNSPTKLAAAFIKSEAEFPLIQFFRTIILKKEYKKGWHSTSMDSSPFQSPLK